MQKKILSMTLAVALLFSLSVPAFAATVTPRWVTTINCDVYLTFSGSTANCNVIIDGKAGTNKIVAKTTLERYNGSGYSTVKSWEQTVYSSSYTLDSTSGNCTSGTYRLTVTATVSNSNGLSDNVSNYIIKTY